ncbi:hypothetical protein CPLU01_06344 [Colletotrichum plurivorum]|uniref:Uncharacterized protein n=1 Tax=Colletotrichum plurivorum TaxID=2175906 RepID=A0A8H6NGK8_9PEZI|nr:hypothetical protein CPLU01_06344 [Colletotrichum plurivorum]
MSRQTVSAPSRRAICLETSKGEGEAYAQHQVSAVHRSCTMPMATGREQQEAHGSLGAIPFMPLAPRSLRGGLTAGRAVACWKTHDLPSRARQGGPTNEAGLAKSSRHACQICRREGITAVESVGGS